MTEIEKFSMPHDFPYQPGSDKMKELKLNSLLEVTKAINENFSKRDLLALYEYVLKDQLGVERLVLYSNYNGWKQFLKFGVKGQLKKVRVEEDLLHIKEITLIESSTKKALDQFNIIIPVFHKEMPLAFVLLGGLNGGILEDRSEVEHLNYLQTLTNIISVAIENKRLAKESLRQERMKKELEVASELQRSMIPTELPKNDRVEMGGFYQPHQQVGGDYYDLVKMNDKEFIFCMGDVSGKGVSAALLMANFQAQVRAIINYTDHTLMELIQELNKKVNERTEGDRFVTFFIGKYDFQTRTLSYINAGHNPPLVVQGEENKWLQSGCPGLGMLEELPFLNQGHEELEPGSMVVCYTDGVVELENSVGNPFGAERIPSVVRAAENKGMEALNRLVLDALEVHKGKRPYRDDTALFSFRVF